MKHTAKKIKAGLYLYRGFKIEYFDYATLGDPECGMKQWNIYGPDEENWSEYGFSLSHAKGIVDRLVAKKI
jgi:hypothetical protein